MRRGKARNGLLPNSLRIISSCLKTVSSNAGSVASTVRSAGASVAASISVPAEDEKDQVLWAGFDKLEISSSSFRYVLLLGYANGFQVLDVEDASNVHELVSKRDGPVTFLQMQPIPAKLDGVEGFRASHPLLLVVAGDETDGSGMVQGGRLSALIRDHSNDPQLGDCISTPTVVRFFSLRSHNYVHVLRFRSAVYIVRCSPRIVAVALAAQIYCFDAGTLENKFSVLTYPMQGPVGINVGHGPIAVGPRWLAYASNNPLFSNTGRLSPQNLTPSPGVSPSTSPSSGSLVARYAMESSKQIAAGIINLGDMGYKTLSKYCQDLLPDGCNSPTTNLSRKTGRLAPATHLNESDNAGMVVVKDFVSKEVISQFRAHTSPISALCFDPSGTLLVTASVHGNNINVFRIMPTCMQNGSGSSSYDWTSSHVHLYKLYRGITTAVIQNICFSHYSQWIAIVSSHGTCHIFVLSPFGGNAGLQTLSSDSDGPILAPILSMPWWSTPTCMKDQQFPPPPATLSVVSRIKNGTSGWLNTVSHIAASAAGKLPTPSGAVAAIFHNSVHHNLPPFHSKANALEHLLVYSPSGHVVQHELLPSSIAESCDSNSRIGSGPLLQIQDEELRVSAEPVQWWDVCRRLNWPERAECTASISCNGHETAEMVVDSSDCEENDSKYLTLSPSGTFKDFGKTPEKSHLYLSNAEVQISSVRMPIWQKTKIRFYMMISPSSERLFSDCASGEIEIEKFSVNEVEIRCKDILPVFDHQRELGGGGRLTGTVSVAFVRMEQLGNAVNGHPKTVSDECSDVGSSRTTEHLLDFEDISSSRPCEASEQSVGKSSPHVSALSTTLVARHVDKMDESMESTLSKPCPTNSAGSFLTYVGGPLIKIGDSSQSNVSHGTSNVSDARTHTEPTDPSADSNNMQEFARYFRKGYCKVSDLDDCHESAEAVTDADSSSSHCEREKSEEDADNDDLPGGVFLFSEEG